MLQLFLIHFFGLISPGPDFLFVVRSAAVLSRRESLAAVVGISVGVGFWAAASMLGLSLLFDVVPQLYGAVMLCGGAYLAYLGVLLVRVRQNIVLDGDGGAAVSGSLNKAFVQGLTVNLSNVKAIVFFSSVIPAALHSLHGATLMLAAWLLILLETFVYFYTVSVLFSRAPVKRFYAQYSRYIDNLSGAVFLFFGAWLIWQGVGEWLRSLSN